VNASILSLALLVSTPPPSSGVHPPGLVEPESGAWAVVHAGQLWVCWEPAWDCFERVVFEGEEFRGEDVLDEDEALIFGEPFELDHAWDDLDRRHDAEVTDQWRIGFWGPRSLWIDLGDQRFRVVHGQRTARPVDEPPPTNLRRIAPPGCGPSAVVPAVINGLLSWREAPLCGAQEPVQTCPSPPAPRVRRPVPIRLRAGLEFASARNWTVFDDAARELSFARGRYGSRMEIRLVLELRFDPQRSTTDERARAVLARRRAAQRELPIVAPGPLAAAEFEALTNIVCGATRS
jgi:hypothetical protein